MCACWRTLGGRQQEQLKRKRKKECSTSICRIVQSPCRSFSRSKWNFYPLPLCDQGQGQDKDKDNERRKAKERERRTKKGCGIGKKKPIAKVKHRPINNNNKARAVVVREYGSQGVREEREREEKVVSCSAWTPNNHDSFYNTIQTPSSLPWWSAHTSFCLTGYF